MLFQKRGEVIEVGAVEETQSGQKLRRVVISDFDSEYPEITAINFWGRSLSQVNNLCIGDCVIIDFSVRSRCVDGKWYTSCNGRWCERQVSIGYAIDSGRTHPTVQENTKADNPVPNGPASETPPF